MHTLRTQDRDNKMAVTISYEKVPMFRGIAFALHHIEKHGGHVDIFSADRRSDIVAEHNRQFGTHLHSQQYAIDHQGQPGWSAANPINRTSHCLYADATIGKLLGVRAGARIPWWALGIDLADRGKQEDVSHFLTVAESLGYHFKQPYSSGSERHHVILTRSPIATLERWNVISKHRSTN